MTEYKVCCGLLHVKTATWIIAIIHLIIVAITLISGILYLTGITDTVDTRGATGQGLLGKWSFAGMMIIAGIWLIFILLLMYGLKKNIANFVLFHLIACVIMLILYIIQLILYIIDCGCFNGNVAWPIVFSVVIALCLYVEYQCYQYLKHAVVLPN